MSFNLDTPLSEIPVVGLAKARQFQRLHLETLRDILWDFPVRHEGLAGKTDLVDVKPRKKVSLYGILRNITHAPHPSNQKLMVSTAWLTDETGYIELAWFHQGFIQEKIKEGMSVQITGRPEGKEILRITNPDMEIISEAGIYEGNARPVYRVSGAITQKLRRKLVDLAIPFASSISEWLPKQFREAKNLPSLPDAIQILHQPADEAEREQALVRLKYGEFFLHHILYAQARRELMKTRAPGIEANKKVLEKALKSLPFPLTTAQTKALNAILEDISKEAPMNRLLEGDVGTGKTVVAALSAVMVASFGWQSALLAPTEILCDQHGESLEQLFGKTLRIAVYTRSIQRIQGTPCTIEEIRRALSAGEIDLIIGTHTLLSKEVSFSKLALMIVDEQQRFGVRQRQALKDRHGDADGIPHLLSMTATPIPRSLALVLYGDLDRSLLDEYPTDRQNIDTRIVLPTQEEQAYETVRRELSHGRQAFVVCPIIEPSDAFGDHSVEQTYRAFSDGPFQDYKLAMLHGKLASKEKNAVMRAFAAGQIDMLISTTVVEVGVDVKNATIMYIEGAERFGLAQLHQLRGRVGRGTEKSQCFLHPTENVTPLALERLEAVVGSQNGFELAEKDLDLRGPGNVFGTDQSGFGQFMYGSFSDMDLIVDAREDVRELLERDPDMKTAPLVKRELKRYIKTIHFE